MNRCSPSSWFWLALPCVCAALSSTCGGSERFPLAEPMWEDPDRNPVAERPEEYFSPFGWDGLDQTLFRPLTRLFAVDPVTPAINVNAFDEVPNSSWFQNRIGLGDFTVEQGRQGACPEDRIDMSGPWVVTDAKPNGANPGFIIRAADGRRYLLKFDDELQPQRATAADVFGSRLYYAIGYHAPCNFIVAFDPDERLAIDPDAETENELGEDVPMTDADVETVLAAGYVLADGRLRASASLFLEGRPLGPWKYQGTRRDDPNDVVDHQERRELRGGKVLAAWLNHFDTREMNTLSMWVEEDGRTYVRHHYIDFGDSFGSDWEIEYLTRRLGFSNYFDISDVLGDTLTLGLLDRPWDRVTWSEAAPIFAYYDVAHFEPDEWEPGYPNPAFSRMDEGDGAWMARIIAFVTEEHIRAMLDEGELTNPEHDAELYHTLLGRRQRILDHYLSVRSPLTHFEVRRGEPDGAVASLGVAGGGAGPTVIGAEPLPTLTEEPSYSGEWICFTDLGSMTGTFDAVEVRYETRMYLGGADEPTWRRLESVAGREDSARVCLDLVDGGRRPAATAVSAAPDAPERYAILDILTYPVPGAEPIPPARLHFYDLGGDEGFRLVGVDRPADDDAPDSSL